MTNLEVVLDTHIERPRFIKTTLYIQVEDIAREYRDLMNLDTRSYTALFYQSLLAREFPHIMDSEIELRPILEILKKYGHSIDLIVVDGKENNRLRLPDNIRKLNLTSAKIVVSPIYGGGIAGSDEEMVAVSEADFGIQVPNSYDEFKRAIENISAGLVGGYAFNHNLYEERNGIVVPKQKT